MLPSRGDHLEQNEGIHQRMPSAPNAGSNHSHWFGSVSNHDRCYCSTDAEACNKFMQSLNQNVGNDIDYTNFVCGANGVVFDSNKYDEVYKVQIGSSQKNYQHIVDVSHSHAGLLPINVVLLFNTSGNPINIIDPAAHTALSKRIVKAVNADGDRAINQHDITLVNESARLLNAVHSQRDVISVMTMPKAIPIEDSNRDVNDILKEYINMCMDLAKSHVIQFDARMQNAVAHDGKMRFIDMDEVCECRAHWRLLFLIMLVHTAVCNTTVRAALHGYIDVNFTDADIHKVLELDEDLFRPYNMDRTTIVTIPYEGEMDV